MKKIFLIICLFYFFIGCGWNVSNNVLTSSNPNSSEPIRVISVLLKSATTVLVGSTEQLTAYINPIKAANKNVTWSSSDASKVTVSTGGLATGIAVGSATITATTVDGGKTATCVVTVSDTPVSVSSVSLNETAASIAAGSMEQLIPVVAPVGATNQNLTWSSSDNTKAIVDANGLVSGVAVGSATITVTTVDGGKTAACVFTVTNYKGWNLDKTNTGIAAAGLTEADLTLFDLSGADTGKGEWVAGEGNILYLYGNQTIEKKILICSGYVKALEGGTIIKNCIIRPSNCASGMAMLSISGGTVENCEIDGSNLGISNIAHTGISASNSIIRKCLIHECDCGIMANNSSGLTVIENNYIYNIFYQPGSDDHLAGCSIWSATGSGFDIINNRIVIDDAGTVGHVSAAFFSQSLKGAISNVRVEGNLLVSPGYVTRLTAGGSVTSLPYSFINNRLQLITAGGGAFGYYGGSSDVYIKPAWSENYIYNSSATDAKGNLITAASVLLN